MKDRKIRVSKMVGKLAFCACVRVYEHARIWLLYVNIMSRLERVQVASLFSSFFGFSFAGYHIIYAKHKV